MVYRRIYVFNNCAECQRSFPSKFRSVHCDGLVMERSSCHENRYNRQCPWPKCIFLRPGHYWSLLNKHKLSLLIRSHEYKILGINTLTIPSVLQYSRVLIMSKLKGLIGNVVITCFIVGVLGMLELLGLSIPRVKWGLSSFNDQNNKIHLFN